MRPRSSPIVSAPRWLSLSAQIKVDDKESYFLRIASLDQLLTDESLLLQDLGCYQRCVETMATLKLDVVPKADIINSKVTTPLPLRFPPQSRVPANTSSPGQTTSRIFFFWSIGRAYHPLLPSGQYPRTEMPFLATRPLLLREDFTLDYPSLPAERH